jgi:hypothetical protein
MVDTNGRKSVFPFKNRPSQSCGPYSRAYIDVKTGSPDPVDFAMTRSLIYWHIALSELRHANSRTTLCKLPEPQKKDQRLLAVCPKNKMASVGSLRNGCTTIGISRLSQRNMPMPNMAQPGK